MLKYNKYIMTLLMVLIMQALVSGLSLIHI